MPDTRASNAMLTYTAQNSLAYIGILPRSSRITIILRSLAPQTGYERAIPSPTAVFGRRVPDPVPTR